MFIVHEPGCWSSLQRERHVPTPQYYAPLGLSYLFVSSVINIWLLAEPVIVGFERVRYRGHVSKLEVKARPSVLTIYNLEYPDRLLIRGGELWALRADS
jgi:hypothetical protein